MKNFTILTESIDFIERNLCQPVTRADIADHCYVSLSMLEKLFHYALGTGIKTYLSKRRMTQAAKDLVDGELSVTDLAMKYQFNSVEVFTRSFKRVWSVNPSEFTATWKFTGLFPKINYEYQKGDDLFMARKRVDISDAYDTLRERAGSYVLCFDAQNLTAFNSVSRKLGDLAVLEEAARIDRAAADDMLVLRIGGDEFALITGLTDLPAVKALAGAVLAHNGEPVAFEGEAYPLSLWCGITTIPKSLRYGDFFTELHGAITDSKL